MNKKKYSSIWRVYVSELYRLFHKRSFWLAFMVLFLYAAADYLHTARSLRVYIFPFCIGS